jgi:branched-chain amino acid transport system substrate-binding protein
MKDMSMRRFGACVAIAAFVSLSLPAIGGADTVRIGAIFSLTGNSSANGLTMRDGIMLGVDEINKRGGVNGNKIELTIEDSRSDPKAAVEAFNKMELARPPLFYLSFLSSVGVALAPLADARNVALVGLVSSAVALTQGHEYVYRYWPLSQSDVPPLLKILQDLKVKKLGILFSNEEYGLEEQRLLKKGFEADGGSVAVQSFELTEAGFRRQIEALKGQDAIFLATLGASLTNAVRQLKEAGFAGPVLMPSSGANPALFVTPDMQGVYLSAPIIYNPTYLYAREAAGKCAARYHQPFNHWAAAGYDFIRLFAGLLEDHPLTRQGVQDALAAGFDYSGVFGPVRVKAGAHEISFPLYPAQILNNTIKFR